MTKKVIIILSLCLLLTGCGTKYKDAETTSDEAFGGYFTLIKEWGGGAEGGFYTIVYANDTKVKYFIWQSGHRGGITPLYNADGSLQVYMEDE